MNLTKDQIMLLRHGLDLACRAEAPGLSQSGLGGLQGGNAQRLAERLVLAVETAEQLQAEYERLLGDQAANPKE